MSFTRQKHTITPTCLTSGKTCAHTPYLPINSDKNLVARTYEQAFLRPQGVLLLYPCSCNFWEKKPVAPPKEEKKKSWLLSSGAVLQHLNNPPVSISICTSTRHSQLIAAVPFSTNAFLFARSLYQNGNENCFLNAPPLTKALYMACQTQLQENSLPQENFLP